MTYARPIATVDIATLIVDGGKLCVGLLTRKNAREPFHGQSALPGGFIRPDEDSDIDAAARRILREKADTTAAYMEQLETRGNAARDPRGWALSVTYAAITPAGGMPALKFLAVDELPQLAFDHNDIVEKAVERLRSKASYSVLPLFLLQSPFTIAEAWEMFCAVSGEPIDAANFRRKILAQDILEHVGSRQLIGPPTKTYRLRPEVETTFRRPVII